MNTVTISCGMIGSREKFHDAFARALSLPQWYGRNLDALHDCLTDIAGETVLRLENWNALETALGPYAGAVRKALTHAAELNPHLTVEFE